MHPPTKPPAALRAACASLALRQVAQGAPPDRERLREVAGDPAWTELLAARRGQLDRQRESVQAPADLSHGACRRDVDHEVPVGGERALEVQLHGGAGGSLGLAVAGRQPKGLDVEHPLTPYP